MTPAPSAASMMRYNAGSTWRNISKFRRNGWKAKASMAQIQAAQAMLRNRWRVMLVTSSVRKIHGRFRKQESEAECKSVDTDADRVGGVS